MTMPGKLPRFWLGLTLVVGLITSCTCDDQRNTEAPSRVTPAAKRPQQPSNGASGDLPAADSKSKAGKNGEKAAGASEGKRPIPRMEADETRVLTRVLPEIAAAKPDAPGATKACRILFVLDTGGVPLRTNSIVCDEQYKDAVLKAAEQWRFAPATGDKFPQTVRLVREIRFTLQ